MTGYSLPCGCRGHIETGNYTCEEHKVEAVTVSLKRIKQSPFVFHCSCGELATHLNVKVGEEVKDFCDECYIFTKSMEKNIK